MSTRLGAEFWAYAVHKAYSRFFWFVLLRSDWLKISRHILSQLAESQNTIILFVCPLKLCINIVSCFSWDLQWSQEKTKTMLIQNLGGHTKNIMVFSASANYRLKSQFWISRFCFPACDILFHDKIPWGSQIGQRKQSHRERRNSTISSVLQTLQ